MPTTLSGTFTFLFTDIEGSTALWEKHPDAMRGALARHDFIMSAAVEGHGGRVFKTVGDAFYAAFDNAPSALHAACRAQRHLADAAHPEIGALRVSACHLECGGLTPLYVRELAPVIERLPPKSTFPLQKRRQAAALQMGNDRPPRFRVIFLHR